METHFRGHPSSMLKIGLKSMGGAVEKVMNGLSDGMAKEWRVMKKGRRKAREDQGY